MKANIMIQARMGSSRMPGKSLQEIAGMPLIKRVFSRLKLVEGVDKIILATTFTSEDDQLAEYFTSLGGDVFRFKGEVNDVLGRFYSAHLKFPSEIIVRVCGDCPLISYDRISQSIQLLRSNPEKWIVSYPTKTVEEGIEVFSAEFLEMLQEKSLHALEREHVSGYYHKNRDADKEIECASDSNLMIENARFSIDTQADKIFFEELFARLGNSYDLSLRKAVDLLKHEPGLSEINYKVIQRNPLKEYPTLFSNNFKELDFKTFENLREWAIESLGINLSIHPLKDSVEIELEADESSSWEKMKQSIEASWNQMNHS